MRFLTPRLFTVNLTVFAEPVIAILSAVLFIGQDVTDLEMIGGAFLLSGLLIGINDERRLKGETTPSENVTARGLAANDVSSPSSLP